MNIQNTGGVQGPNPIQPSRNPYVGKQQSAPAAGKADKAEISDQARFLQKLSETDEIRQDKVDSVRSQIEAGTYETDDKLDAAVQKLLEDLR